MLHGDPTEAIHSELIMETVERYFSLVENNPIGGGLAYLVLSFNRGVHDDQSPERDAVVRRVLDADVAWTAAARTAVRLLLGHAQQGRADRQGGARGLGLRSRRSGSASLRPTAVTTTR